MQLGAPHLKGYKHSDGRESNQGNTVNPNSVIWKKVKKKLGINRPAIRSLVGQYNNCFPILQKGLNHVVK